MKEIENFSQLACALEKTEKVQSRKPGQNKALTRYAEETA